VYCAYLPTDVILLSSGFVETVETVDTVEAQIRAASASAGQTRSAFSPILLVDSNSSAIQKNALSSKFYTYKREA
jgi:hypothetical protein